MRRKRPASVLTIAVLHFVVAGLGACLVGVQLARLDKLLAAQPGFGDREEQRMEEEMEAYLRHNVPAAKVIEGLEMGASLLFSGMLVVAGVGLLRMQPWARVVSIVYACLSLVLKVVLLIFVFAVLLPGLQPFIRQMSAQNPELGSAMEIGAAVGGIASQVLKMPYPIAVLIVLLLPSTAAAFRRPEPDRHAEDEEDDVYRRRPPEERYPRRWDEGAEAY